MTLSQILAAAAFALLAGWFFPPRWRLWAMLAGSLLAVYALQPATPVRNLGFWLATASVGLALLVWAIIRADQPESRRGNLIAAGSLAGGILLLALTRYLTPLCCLTPARPPQAVAVLLALVLWGALAALASRSRQKRLLAWACSLLLLVLFLVLKTEWLAGQGSAWLRALAGQDASLASPLDLQWLGFSYLAFRLLHVLRDWQAGRGPRTALPEFMTYALFFPALVAGPIDRCERFTGDLRAIPQLGGFAHNLPPEDLVEGLKRLLLGVFKKFALADSLALIALNPQFAAQIHSSLWMWVALYAYALRIYLDFSGYTDVAIGLARLMGVHLPENFLAPYAQTNLTAFWNSWHITLAQWFRSYFFNPLTRFLRTRHQDLPAWSVILLAQCGTMLLIGLWHGVTWNFALWGLWHAAGLFIHNRWSEWQRRHPLAWLGTVGGQRAARLSGWLLTFNHVTLGWVFFALPDLPSAAQAARTLFGV